MDDVYSKDVTSLFDQLQNSFFINKLNSRSKRIKKKRAYNRKPKKILRVKDYPKNQLVEMSQQKSDLSLLVD